MLLNTGIYALISNCYAGCVCVCVERERERERERETCLSPRSIFVFVFIYSISGLSVEDTMISKDEAHMGEFLFNE